MEKIKNIMVCVTSQKSCERLINRGVERRAGEGELHVVHCVQTGQRFMNYPTDAEALEYLFTASQLAGGDLQMIRADNVDDALVDYAQENQVNVIVMGAPGQGSAQSNIVSRLQRRLPEVEFDVVR